MGAERSFGLVFATVFAIVAFYPLLNEGGIRVWALAIAGLFAVLAFVLPVVLKPLNWVWFKFGLLLHQITTPIVLGILFFLVMTPIAWMLRILGRRPLNLTADRMAATYWVARQPIGPDPQSMSNQF